MLRTTLLFSLILLVNACQPTTTNESEDPVEPNLSDDLINSTSPLFTPISDIPINDYKRPSNQEPLMAQMESSTGYEIIDLGHLGYGYSEGNAINDAGSVTGYSTPLSTHWHAFKWNGNQMIDLGAFPHRNRRANGTDINNSGQVVGTSRTSTPNSKYLTVPTIWENDNTFYEIGDLNTYDGHNPGNAAAISDDGTVVGTIYFPGRNKGFVWSKENGMSLKLIKTNWTRAYRMSFSGINNSGKAVGSYSTIYSSRALSYDIENDQFTDHRFFGQQPARNNSSISPTDINDKGQIVGHTYGMPTSSSHYRAFFYDPVEGFTYIEPPAYISGFRSIANAVNNSSQVVGTYYGTIDGKSVQRAYVWTKEDGLQDLGVLDEDAQEYWYDFSRGNDINDLGQVTGTSLTKGGKFHAVIWNANLNQAPVANAGDDKVIECNAVETRVNLDGSESFDPDGDVIDFLWRDLYGLQLTTNSTYSPLLAVGQHSFVLEVTDPELLSDKDTVVVSINDLTPPSIFSEQLQANLWPPNNKITQVLTGISAVDLCDPAAELTISVHSNSNGKPGKDTDPDWKIVQSPDGQYSVWLRAEKGTGKTTNSRYYDILIEAEDKSGNKAQNTIRVTVEKKKK